MKTMLLACAALAVAAAPGVAALVWMLRRHNRRHHASSSSRPMSTPTMASNPDDARIRRLVPELETRLATAEVEIKALRDAVAGIQEAHREAAERAWGSSRLSGYPEDRYSALPRSYGPNDDPLVRDDDAGRIVRDDVPDIGWIGAGDADGEGIGVDLDGGNVVPSRSLQAVARLVGGNDGRPGRLYLNESIEIDHMALERWKEFFDFAGGEPYRRYRTDVPAQVDWNGTASRGRLSAKGRARQL